MTDEELGNLGVSRRDFIRKMLAIGFAVPVVSSFTLDDVASAHDKPFGNQMLSNQHHREHHHDHRHHHHHHHH